MNGLLLAGRLHPVLVHLPIGLLAAVALVEVLAIGRRSAELGRLARVLLGVTALAALVAAASGWQLAETLDPDDELLDRHRWSGVALAAWLALVAWRARGAGARRLGVFVALLLATVVGHFGGALTHGRTYLSEVGPAWLGIGLGAPQPGAPPSVPGAGSAADGPATVPGAMTAPGDPASVPGAASGDREAVFALIATRCVECHGPRKAKHDLRLDTAEGLLSVVTPGAAPKSEMFARLTLPASDLDAMPPEGPRVDGESILALMRWINAGALLDGSGQLPIAPPASAGADPPDPADRGDPADPADRGDPAGDPGDPGDPADPPPGDGGG